MLTDVSSPTSSGLVSTVHEKYLKLLVLSLRCFFRSVSYSSQNTVAERFDETVKLRDRHKLSSVFTLLGLNMFDLTENNTETERLLNCDDIMQ